MSFRFARWSPNYKNRLALEALFELGYARLLRGGVRFARIAQLFGEPQTESPLEIELNNQMLAREIGIAICRASRFAPFQCNCLTQAICGLRMLKRRKISSTLYLGVERVEDSLHDAHAWLRCGDTIITGNHRLERYKAVFKFARS